MKDNAKTTPSTNPENGEKFAVMTSHANEFAILPKGEGAPIRISTASDDVTLFNAVNGSGENVADYIGKDVELVNIVVTSVDVHSDPNDDDSPIINKSCVNMFTSDGKMISSISNGIARSVKSLFNVGFAPTPKAPITVRFKQSKTKRGMAHTFDLIKRG